MLIGFTLPIIRPSTWRTEPSCYLEDLIVDPGHRGGGVASALIDDLLDLARERGWGLYRHTQSGNATARQLYDRYVEADHFVRYRISIWTRFRPADCDEPWLSGARAPF